MFLKWHSNSRFLSRNVEPRKTLAPHLPTLIIFQTSPKFWAPLSWWGIGWEGSWSVLLKSIRHQVQIYKPSVHKFLRFYIFGPGVWKTWAKSTSCPWHPTLHQPEDALEFWWSLKKIRVARGGGKVFLGLSLRDRKRPFEKIFNRHTTFNRYLAFLFWWSPTREIWWF